MAEWRVRPLASFSRLFLEAMSQGEGVDKLIWRGLSHAGALDAQNQFRIFRYSIRATPGPLREIETSLYHRTRRRWNGALKAWEVLLTSKPSALSELENPEILG